MQSMGECAVPVSDLHIVREALPRCRDHDIAPLRIGLHDAKRRPHLRHNVMPGAMEGSTKVRNAAAGARTCAASATEVPPNLHTVSPAWELSARRTACAGWQHAATWFARRDNIVFRQMAAAAAGARMPVIFRPVSVRIRQSLFVFGPFTKSTTTT